MKIGAVLAGMLTVSVQAAPPEIDSLLAGLERSGCRFQRNGTWYDAAKAADHLRAKRAYLEKKGKIGSAEDFIRLAASGSSMTGKPYRVACPAQPEVESKVWLEERLRSLRAGK